MRKFLFSIALVTMTYYSATAQIVNLVGATNVLYGTSSNAAEELNAHWSVVNATSQTLDINCKRWIIQEVPNTMNQFCWGDYCFGYSTDVSSEAVQMGAGTSNASFHGYYRHLGNAGQTIIAYCFYDFNNPSNEFCYDVNFCVDGACTVGVVEENTTLSTIEIAPNPVSQTGTINYAFNSRPENARMIIYNTVGAIVKEIPLTTLTGAVLIDARDFESGFYFCSLESNGQVLQTSRLMISK